MSHATDSAPVLFVADASGRYTRAKPQQVLASARQIIDKSVHAGVPMTSPKVVCDYLTLKLAGLEHEVFAALFLTTRHQLIGYTELFRGTIDGAVVHPREVVKAALAVNAAAVIFAHNHPSGIAEPSESDRSITIELKNALELVSVRVLDHIVVGGPNTVSLAQRGWL